jgi:hypothetical protein
VCDDRADDRERVEVVLGEVIRHPGEPGVYLGAAERLGAHLLAGGRLDERRAAEEDRARAADDHDFVAHRRDVRATGGAGAHDRRDLRDALGAHLRLVVEDPPEVLAIREYLGLKRQEGAAAVYEVDAGQVVLLGDLLGAQVLLDGQRIVGAPFDGRVVGDDHHLAAADAPDAGDHPRRRDGLGVDLVGGERRQLEEGSAGIE